VTELLSFGVRASCDGIVKHPPKLRIEILLDIGSAAQCFRTYTLSEIAMKVVG
jgi:hypothetical protein